MPASSRSTPKSELPPPTRGSKGTPKKKATRRAERANAERRAEPRPSHRPVQIVVPDVTDRAQEYRLFRVFAGWLTAHSTTGIEFETPARLSGAAGYVEFRTGDAQLKFKSISIVDESPTDSGQWQYAARFERRFCIVERYEFD